MTNTFGRWKIKINLTLYSDDSDDMSASALRMSSSIRLASSGASSSVRAERSSTICFVLEVPVSGVIPAPMMKRKNST